MDCLEAVLIGKSVSLNEHGRPIDEQFWVHPHLVGPRDRQLRAVEQFLGLHLGHVLGTVSGDVIIIDTEQWDSDAEPIRALDYAALDRARWPDIDDAYETSAADHLRERLRQVSGWRPSTYVHTKPVWFEPSQVVAKLVGARPSGTRFDEVIEVDFETSGGPAFLKIEQAFRYESSEKGYDLDPRSDRGDLMILRELIGHRVTSATADRAGALVLAFDAQLRLSVAAHSEFEAWTLVMPPGTVLVATPEHGVVATDFAESVETQRDD